MCPKVSVLMPVYNGASYLSEAIESILNQDFTDFEFIIIDDSSSDTSVDVIHTFRDSRIRFLQNEKNLGQTETLNKGIRLAQGQYLARQDQDDFSYPQRLKLQVDFLDTNPLTVIVGSNIKIIDSNSVVVADMVLPINDTGIRWQLLYRPPFAHPSVMIRKRVLDDNNLYYDTAYRYVQDYALWAEILRHGQGANIRQSLLGYRVHATNTSVSNLKEVMNEHRLISHSILKYILSNISDGRKIDFDNLLKALLKRSSKWNFSKNIVSNLAIDYWDLFLHFSKSYSLDYDVQKIVLGDLLYLVAKAFPSGLLILLKAIYKFPLGWILTLLSIPSELYRFLRMHLFLLWPRSL